MSDEPMPAMESTPTEKQRKPLSEWVRVLMIGGIALVIILILVWTGRMQKQQAETAAYGRMGDALAQSLVPQFLARNWPKTEQELARIAEAGNFSEITITDVNGVMLASTTRNPARPETLKGAGPTARVFMEGNDVRIERKVMLAQGNPLGAVRFIARR